MKLKVLGVFAFILSAVACSAPKTSPLADLTPMQIATEGVEKGLWPGIMWAKVAPGEVLSVGSAGFANVERQTAMRPETLMPIASISKVLIGLSAAHAIQAGELDPNAPLSRYLDLAIDAPDTHDRTFLQLAKQTSGIRDTKAGYEDGAYHIGDPLHPIALRPFLSAYLTKGGAYYDPNKNFGNWAPGTRYEYTNVGSAVAALAIEDATNQPFATYSRRTVIEPLGLSGDWAPVLNFDKPRATLYEKDTGFVALPPYGLATWPDGRFYASAKDLGTLLATIAGGGVLNGRKRMAPEVVDLLTDAYATGLPGQANPENSEGLFWTQTELGLPSGVVNAEGFDGSDPGVFTMMFFVPEQSTGFVVMTNSEPEGRQSMRQLAYLVDAILRQVD